MSSDHRLGRAALVLAPLALTLCIASTRPAFAQAWAAPAGIGSITLAFEDLDYSGHLATDGTFAAVARSVHNRVDVEFDYAITDRLSVTAGIPYVFARYVDPGPLPDPIPTLPVDECRCWQSGWQDFGFAVRYNLVNGAFGLTPSVSVGVPSHEYNYRGEAALGERLKELRIAIDAGQRLDAISPRLSVQARYSYAFVEQVLEDVTTNRSNTSVEGGFLISRRFAARGLLAWQRVHGGLRVGSGSGDPMFPGEIDDTPERMYEHDRLLRDNYFRLGAGVSYSMDRMDVFFFYLQLLRGNDSHAGRSMTVGVSWPFEIGGWRSNP
jgi:hypothetical protein